MKTVRGRLVGRFRIEGLVGRGGMGAVYAARDTHLDRTVALKLLLREPRGDRDLVELGQRLRDEARAAVRIKHPALVEIIDAGEDDELGPYVAYEFFSRGTLRSLLDEEGGLGWEGAFERVGRPLLTALAALHAGGVLHRDVKPGNLFQGNDGTFKLGDLGLARFSGREACTRTGQLVGTPAYLPPDRFVSTHCDATAADDCYAAALVLVEAVEDTHIMWARRRTVGIDKLFTRPLSSSEVIEAGVPPHHAPVLTRALALRPEERYANARSLLDDLSGKATPGATSARPGHERRGPPDHTLAATVVARARRWRLFLALLLVATAGTFIARLVAPTRAPHPTASDPSSLEAIDEAVKASDGPPSPETLHRLLRTVAPTDLLGKTPAVGSATRAEARAFVDGLAEGSFLRAAVTLAIVSRDSGGDRARPPFLETVEHLRGQIVNRRSSTQEEGLALFAVTSSHYLLHGGPCDEKLLEIPRAILEALSPKAFSSPWARVARTLLVVAQLRACAVSRGRDALSLLPRNPALPPLGRHLVEASLESVSRSLPGSRPVWTNDTVVDGASRDEQKRAATAWLARARVGLDEALESAQTTHASMRSALDRRFSGTLISSSADETLHRDVTRLISASWSAYWYALAANVLERPVPEPTRPAIRVGSLVARLRRTLFFNPTVTAFLERAGVSTDLPSVHSLLGHELRLQAGWYAHKRGRGLRARRYEEGLIASALACRNGLEPNALPADWLDATLGNESLARSMLQTIVHYRGLPRPLEATRRVLEASREAFSRLVMRLEGPKSGHPFLTTTLLVCRVRWQLLLDARPPRSPLSREVERLLSLVGDPTRLSHKRRTIAEKIVLAALVARGTVAEEEHQTATCEAIRRQVRALLDDRRDRRLSSPRYASSFLRGAKARLWP